MKKILVTLFVLFFAAGCGRAFQRTKFIEGTTSGNLKIGMTKDEVKNLLGNPDRVSARQNQYDIREVWTYLQTSEEDKRKHTGLTIGTFGLFGALPVGATEHHYIVFSGDKMIGWDLPDPYAPDLIIEKRER